MDQSLLGYFVHAGPVVKLVMLGLLVVSITSWTFIFQKGKLLKARQQAIAQFEDKFWSGAELSKLYQALELRRDLHGMEAIFQAGFKEFMRVSQPDQCSAEELIGMVQRSMRVAHWREMDELEQQLPFLATVGSTSPYIGLFGTVWGIMSAFHSLGSAQQATIAMVAPGISEALIATAMGLFAAIPAVVSYNRYSTMVERLGNHYEAFQEELAGILCHSARGKAAVGNSSI